MTLTPQWSVGKYALISKGYWGGLNEIMVCKAHSTIPGTWKVFQKFYYNYHHYT